jgi:hypothetical protein
MKCVITGHTSGLGKSFFDYFSSLGWNVIGYNTETGLTGVLEDAIGCDLFINNAYANGIQIELLNQLYNKVDKMIVCGSIASDIPDTDLPDYSRNKKELEQRVLDITNVKNKNHADILLLKLTSSSYKNTKLIIDTVNFWLENPSVISVAYNIEDSNED